MKYNYLIGTGWWCTNSDDREDKFLNGDDQIRGVEFHQLWAKSIATYTNPQKIVVIDSDSPIKPNWKTDILDFEVITLLNNLGHATSLVDSKFCGWSASVIMSMQYANLSDVDFYVYIEQDALVYGNNIIEENIRLMQGNVDFLFGSSETKAQPLQQSFFIIRRAAIDKFLVRLMNIKYSDAQICPEVKFAIASSPLSIFFPKFLFKQYPGKKIGKFSRRFVVLLCRIISGYKFLKFGYGRTRPINFMDKHLYFQHGNTEELIAYKNLLSRDLNLD